MSDPAAPVVLLVEDSEPDIVLTIEGFGNAGVEVDLVVATDGERAVELLGEVAAGGRPMPALVLLDLNLPKIGGLQILEFIKTHPVLGPVPVVVMSTSRSPADVQAAYAGHANSFIVKPHDFRDFVGVLRSIGDYWFGTVHRPAPARPACPADGGNPPG